MATDISTFKSAIEHGGARPSLFDVTISQPQSMSGSTITTMSSQCSVSAIPALSVTPIERQYLGRTVKIPGDMVFADLTTTIINSEDYEIRSFCEKWMDKINGHSSNIGLSSNQFQGSVTLTQYAKSGDMLMQYAFKDCWPQTISEIALSYDTASDIETFDITWSYNYYTTFGFNDAADAAFLSDQE